MRQRKFDLRVLELLHACALAVRHFDGLHLDDLNAVRLRAMASAHVAVALRHGAGLRHVPILAIHVVVPGARVVAQPDAVVLHGARLLLEHLNIRSHSKVSHF